MCMCVLIPGRTSSDSELLGSSVGVPDFDTGKKQSKRERRKEREGGGKRERERSRAVALVSPTHTHRYTEENHPQ